LSEASQHLHDAHLGDIGPLLIGGVDALTCTARSRTEHRRQRGFARQCRLYIFDLVLYEGAHARAECAPLVAAPRVKRLRSARDRRRGRRKRDAAAAAAAAALVRLHFPLHGRHHERLFGGDERLVEVGRADVQELMKTSGHVAHAQPHAHIVIKLETDNKQTRRQTT